MISLLVAFESRYGQTRKLAERIADSPDRSGIFGVAPKGARRANA